MGDRTIQFESKARTLRSLRGSLENASVPNLFLFTCKEWKTSPEQVLDDIQRHLKSELVAVRSSAANEDSLVSSHAGEFSSILNIQTESRGQLQNAIEEVFASYGKESAVDECFIQEQITDVQASGVIFTRELSTHAPYYVCNYDDSSGKTDSVTSGTSASLKTQYVARGHAALVHTPWMKSLLGLAEELEQRFGSDHLDIEFAVGSDDSVFLLQVRPITTVRNAADDDVIHKALRRTHSKVKKLMSRHPGQLGEKSVFSVMTDWNPAEILGVKPRPLAVSLYKELITDSVWAIQRHKYGYRDLRSFPLLISLMGFPYIDVRTSFNSFIPSALDQQLGEKLTNYYIQRLEQEPTLHDKAEFEIVHSCYTLTTHEELKDLHNSGFSELEIDRLKYALINLTNSIIQPGRSPFSRDVEKIEELKKRQASTINSTISPIEQIYWLTEDCKRYGTLPFAGLARGGFIAMQLLHSMVETGVLTSAEMERFMLSLDTVASKLSQATSDLQANRMRREEFLSEFGHLRPGTYDICSKTYSQAFEQYFGTTKQNASESNARAQCFEFSSAQLQRLEELLRLNGLLMDAPSLINFIRTAIEGREYGKFVFTKSLSHVLEIIASLGERHGFSREELSFLDFQTVKSLYSSVTEESLHDIFAQSITRNERQYKNTEALKLPSLLVSPDDVYCFSVNSAEPNFVTQSRVRSTIVIEADLEQVNLKDKIVFIRSADPGFDWIFSQAPAGLVTMFGGSNSHMAIRCAELGIPGVIGCGETNFLDWSRYEQIEIDCLNKQIHKIS